MKRFVCAMRMVLAALVLVVRCAAACTADAASGMIAYVTGAKGGDEIHLIQPDGGGDHRIWRLPNACFTGVTGLAWRPDGKEIAFTSDHAATLSLYDSDLYLIRPDGGGLRRLTNGPDPSELKRFPTGRMVVKIENRLSDISVFTVYVAGATKSQMIPLGAHSARTLTFDVADFGDNSLHWVVAMYGQHRWLFPGGVVHAGQAAGVVPFVIGSTNHEHFGAFGPAWRSDGKRVGFILGTGVGVYWISAHPAPGSIGAPVIGGKEAVFASVFDWGPPALADQILYGGGVSDNAIHRTTEGAGRGEKLVDIQSGNFCTGLHWLPDGSGFLFSVTDGFLTVGNLYRYEFTTKKITQLTHFTQGFAANFSIAPDGRSIVFERRKRATVLTSTSDLWIMRSDGSNMRLLVHNAWAPAWSKQ